MPKLSIEELERIREKARGAAHPSKDGPYKAKVTVHMGTCGIATGARDIMEAFRKEIQESNVHDVFLTNSGCAGLCSREPMATVEYAGKPPVKYIELTPEKAKEIFNSHIMKGHPVEAYVLASGSERSL